MSCYSKRPLSQEEKDRIIREAERKGPLSDAEKARLIEKAERARQTCTDDSLLQKLLYALALLGGLLLAYYLFNHFIRKPAKPEAVVTETVTVVEKPVIPIHEAKPSKSAELPADEKK